MTDKPRGLNPDFSDAAVQGRIFCQTSGIPPHLRPGHLAPEQPAIQHEPSEAGVEALRQHNLNDGIEHT